MATSFPTGLDALTNPTSANGLNSPDHAGQHSDANDAIEALQAKVGINSSAVTSSLDYKITNINASNLASGTVPAARISGSYTGITGVGTLTVGSIPASLLTGTTLPSSIVTSSLTSVGTITSGTWSGSFGAVSGANLTTLNASNISSGTLSNARLPAAATTITSVGTLGSLAVSGDITSANTWVTSYLIANPGVTSSGQSAQWFTAFGFWYLCRNSSTRNDKENIQSLNGVVTPDMIDDIDVLLWSRKNAAGIPEIGPMAEDMDEVSPFLSIRGMDCDEEGNIVPTAPSGINQNSWLSLLTLGIQDLRKRVAELETA